MGIDWKLLTQVRDRHKAVAQEHVARERAAAAHREAQVLQAQAQLHAQVVAKTQLWQDTIVKRTEGFSVSELRDAGNWSRALDMRIAQAGESVRHAQLQAAQQAARLEASRRELRTAAAELERAEQMRQRTKSEHARATENRLDDAADEAATQTWISGKAS